MIFDIYKIDGSLSDEKLELSDSVFGITPNNHVIYLDVKAYLANQRQGTHKAKERSEVSGGGKKPFRQKGTGRARAGTSRSPLWVGGGTIFGPKPRDYRQDLPKKVKALARKSALSLKVQDNGIKIVEDFNFEEPKTKNFVSLLNSLKITNKKVLLLTNDNLPNVFLAARNIPKINVLKVNHTSTYDILNHQILLIQKSAASTLNQMLIDKKEMVDLK